MSADPITAVSDLATSIIDRIWPDANEKQKAELSLMLGQLDINKNEAKSTNWFVAGWRPFIGWVCGMGFAWTYLIGPVANWISIAVGHPVPLPILDTGALVTMLGGLLGLGTMRTVEKSNGSESNR